MKTVLIESSFESWKEKALGLIEMEAHPSDVHFATDAQSFFFEEPLTVRPSSHRPNLPRSFVEGSRIVAAHRDPETYHLLYRILWRLTHGEKNLLDDPFDPDSRDFELRKKSVTRDMHKMKAFVRFKKIIKDNDEVFSATHFPDHRIIRLVAPFFQDRFQGMNWIIKTPDETAIWDQKNLIVVPTEGELKEEEDSEEDLWKTYYSAIFNPARIKLKAMVKEMPKRHWKSLPETELIDELVAEAPERLKKWAEHFPEATVQQEFMDIESLNHNLRNCKACEICPKATAPVPGHGKINSRIMLIGEQPGDEEDLSGKPFVGPSGQFLNQALSEVGLDRSEMYVTNAVKGFKFMPMKNQRWHKGATLAEVATCKPWLVNEVKLVRPEIIVCLGRTAAQSVMGKMVKMEEVRGKFFRSSLSPMTFVMPHPASILRSSDPEGPREKFLEELKILKKALQNFDTSKSRV